jgi:hypothetical protein
MSPDYFARHPVRIASAWPTTEIALLNSGSDFDSARLPTTGVHALETGDQNPSEDEKYGMVERESDEFLAQFDPLSPASPNRTIPDFELDLSQAKTAEFFEVEALAAVPHK